MPRRRNEDARVLGPYWVESKAYWKATILNPRAADPGRRRVDRYFGDEQEANDWVKDARERLVRLTDTTVLQAIESYDRYLHEKGTGLISRTETGRRLKLFFRDHNLPISRVTVERAEGYYKHLRTIVSEKTGKKLSVDTHRNILSEAKSFGSWCVATKLLATNPIAGIVGTGRRRKGKPQLTADEAKRWTAVALGRAHMGDTGALVALMTIMMGLRASEITKRVVRDLDEGGTVLRVEDAKTEAGNRSVAVPHVLQPLLIAQTLNRSPFAVLFPRTDGARHAKNWPTKNVKRLCLLAGLQEVCAHSMRGAHATLAVGAGVTPHVVAMALGHESPVTTQEHYTQPEASSLATQTRTLSVLQGGRR